MQDERRKYERHVINRAAKFRSEAGALPRECLIADISKYGARLFVDGAEVPDHFELMIAGADGISRQCDVMWRLNGEIGVAFVDAELPGADPAFG
ncbi:MAG: PilZ domain-containing protein [Pseudolabrys sp.]